MKKTIFIFLTVLCSFPVLQAQNAHYATGEVFIDRGGFMYIRTADTLILEGAMVTVRNTNEAQRGMLSFAGTSEWKSGNSSFVNGFVRTNSTGAFTFPIGQTSYRPARISAAASTAPTDAAYYTPALYSTSALGSGIVAVTNESWVIQGTTPAVITLSWTSNITSFADNLSKLCIAGWDGAKWVKIESAADVVSPIFESASMLTGSGSVSTAAAIVPNTYSAYTLASVLPVYKVEIVLVGNVGSDAATIADPFGNVGEVIDIDYVVGTSGIATNSVAFTGGVVVDGGTSPATYTIVAADAIDGVITITATFTHTDIPTLSGAVNLSVNSATGAVTALASGGNTASMGTLTYTWSGGASGTGTTATPTLGVPATCTVTASDGEGEISASITVYKVETTLAGNVGADAATIINPYGKVGTTINIDYVVGISGTATNSVAFTGGTVVDGGASPAKYTIVASDATSGIITITATFTHTDISTLSGTVNLSLNSATGAVTALASGGNTASMGTLTYTWSGGASGTGTTATPALGIPATCTVTASGGVGSISASITVYKVEVALVGNVGADAASITNPYGKAGDVKNINYVVGTSGTASNSVAFTGGTVVDGGTSPATYAIVAANAKNGVIKITATFIHIDFTYIISATPLLAFGTLAKPYTPPAEQTVTVTNTGTGAITLVQPTSANYVVGALSTTTLSVTGATATFTVQPKPGLPIGDYSETITITGNNGASATVTVTFTVICPSDWEDIDGNNYSIKTLAGLCWTPNLKTTKYADGTDIVWANPYYSSQYPDMNANKDIYGLLYTWYAAMNLLEGEPLPMGNIQGICPDGWRIPTSDEWALLKMYDADNLKNPAYWLQPNSNTNSLQFDCRGAGFYNSATQRFESLFGYTAYWITNTVSAVTSLGASLTYYCNQLEIIEIKKMDAVSVRCVME